MISRFVISLAVVPYHRGRIPDPVFSPWYTQVSCVGHIIGFVEWDSTVLQNTGLAFPVSCTGLVTRRISIRQNRMQEYPPLISGGVSTGSARVDGDTLAGVHN